MNERPHTKARDTIAQRQKIAVTNPCARAQETTRAEFHRIVGRWSTILTVNK